MSEAAANPAISVVIPLYNEEENLPTLQRELFAALEGRVYEIVFVDDGSKDATTSKVEQRPEVRLLRFEKNAGQSAAMFAGIQAARGGVIVLLVGEVVLVVGRRRG